MKFYSHKDVQRFQQRCVPFLLKREVENNILLGVYQKVVDGDFFFEITDEQDQILACGMKNPVNFVLSPINQEQIDFLIPHLLKITKSLPGCLGLDDSAEYFCQKFSRVTGQEYLCCMEQMIYKLTNIENHFETQEEVRFDRAEDETELINLVWDFCQEALSNQNILKERIEVSIKTKMGLNEMLLLIKNQKIVALAFIARHSLNGACIGPVYTVKEHRGKGYGSVLVSKLSQEILNRNKTFACLYTDLKNPTSNSIYKKIGYKEVCPSRHFIFK